MPLFLPFVGLALGAAGAIAAKNTLERPDAVELEDRLRDIAKNQEGPAKIKEIGDAGLLMLISDHCDMRAAYEVEIPGCKDQSFKVLAVAEKGGDRAILTMRKTGESVELTKVMDRLTLSPSLARARLREEICEAVDEAEILRARQWIGTARYDLPVDQGILDRVLSTIRRESHQLGLRLEINEDTCLHSLRNARVYSNFLDVLLALEEEIDFVTDVGRPEYQARLMQHIETVKDLAYLGMYFGARSRG